MRGRIGGYWPLIAIALFLAAGSLVLYKVWQAPNRNDLVAYGGFAVTVVTLMAGWIASAWRAKARPARACPVDLAGRSAWSLDCLCG
jgi:peptidoglycan/LPS O-acetylase OafA/YrhL